VYLAAECISVGRACGFEVEPIMGIAARRFVDAAEGRGLAEVEADISAAARKRGGGRPSMLQDVMRRRRTEIEQLNGYVVAEGRRLGIKTPFNEKAVELYRAHGVARLRPDPKNLEPLLAMLPHH
jgi:2-dehydropantoate 2-reductase